MTQPVWIYISLVVGGGAVALYALLKVIARYKNRRLDRLESLDAINPISTVSPPGDSTASTLELAADSISGRFSIIRKGVIVTAILLIILVGFIPFYGSLPLASISLLVSALGIILGIAARPIIENFISGILLSFSSGVRLGDTVIIDGYYGTIEDISFLHTSIKTWDWKRFIISNADMLKRQLVNFSVRDKYIWAHVEFFVAITADLPAVRSTALRIAEQYKSKEVEENPRFWVMDMEKTAVKCWIAAWATSPAEAWQMKHHIRTDLILALQELGIQTHLNHHQVDPAHLSAAGKG